MSPFATQPTEQWLYRPSDDIVRHINDPEPQLCLRGIENMDHQTEVATEAAAIKLPRFCFTHNYHIPREREREIFISDRFFGL